MEIPKLCKQKNPKGDLAYVKIDGTKFYCGKWDTPEAVEKYQRIIAEWSLTKQIPVSSVAKKEPVTINMLVDVFLKWAKTEYIKNGRQTSTYAGYKYAVQVLLDLYGSLPVDEFKPKALKTVRDQMIFSRTSSNGEPQDMPIGRNTVNARIDDIRFIFKWGVSEEMVEETTWNALKSVLSLVKGETPAKDRPKTKPVPMEWVMKTIPFLPTPVAAMVQLHILNAMRSSEVTSIRACDIDMSRDIWIYTPWEHKTEHIEDAENYFAFGFESQKILTPWLMDKEDTPEAWLFSPRDTMRERKTKLREKRKTPVQPSQRDRSKPEHANRVGDRYTKDSYRRCIRRACEKAGVPYWHPHQLKHTGLTKIRALEGPEAAQVQGNHRNIKTTEIYAEKNLALKLELARKYT